MGKTSGSFVKGDANNKGKPKGALNKFTKTVKERVLDTFNELQEDKKANLLAWSKENTTEFYKIAAKLIPTEIAGNLETTINIKILKKP